MRQISIECEVFNSSNSKINIYCTLKKIECLSVNFVTRILVFAIHLIHKTNQHPQIPIKPGKGGNKAREDLDRN